eukprot:scaffold3240_cov197-Alexandrium_tamarense.AAC.8
MNSWLGSLPALRLGVRFVAATSAHILQLQHQHRLHTFTVAPPHHNDTSSILSSSSSSAS